MLGDVPLADLECHGNIVPARVGGPRRRASSYSWFVPFRRRRSPGAPDFRVPAPPRDTPDDEVVWRAIEQIFTELRTPYEPDERLFELTPGQRAVYALDWVRKEVSNGGFDQLFGNSTGYLMPEALEGAEYIGATDYADVLRRAAAVFRGGEVPRDRDERTDVLDAEPARIGPVLEALDEEFYALLDDHERNLTRLMAIFIAENAEQFFVKEQGVTDRTT